MTEAEYRAWAETRAGIPSHPVLRPLRDDDPVETTWPDGAFRCNPFGCRKVCCTGWPEAEGIRLKLADLVRLRAAGLLDSAEGRFAVDPPDFPRLRSADGHCVHYDPATRQCTIWEQRPLICRSYPYALAWANADGGVGLSFEHGCSLTPVVAPRTTSSDPIRPERVLAIRRSTPTTRAGDLSTYERSHLEACIESVNEHERTHRIVAERPELLRELGVERFGADLRTGTETSPPSH